MNKDPFEIGLTMAGAVSAGAYTAGVVDFLVEALDAWEAAKLAAAQGGPAVPTHEVSLRVMSGASAGAIVAAILAANADLRWEPVRSHNADVDDVPNPLFQSWVNAVDIRRMLGVRDLEQDALPLSALDGTVLDEIARKAFSHSGTHILRRWIADPLRAIFTLTNLTGVPYRYDMRGNTDAGQDRSMHGDLIRYAVLGAGMPVEHPVRSAPGAAHEYALRPVQPERTKWSSEDWRRFAMSAIASGAFPAGLRPRAVVRDAADYDGILVAVPGDPPAWMPTRPAWLRAPGEQYSFLSVDGGCIDNEPLELAREELARSSVSGRNARDGDEATCAVLMVDPFVGPGEPGPRLPGDNPLHKSLFSLLSAYTENSRFSSADISLAMQEDVYSRFLVAPRRPTPPLKREALAARDEHKGQGTWLASGALGGFSGFLHRDFRRHDFLLGRRNCQAFLANHFTLKEGNPLFAGWKNNAALVAHYLAEGAVGAPRELPIVPLVGTLHPRHGLQEALPEWPQDRFSAADIRKELGVRIDALLKKYTSGAGVIGGFFLGLAWKLFARSKVLDAAEKALDEALVKQGLLSPAPATVPGTDYGSPPAGG